MSMRELENWVEHEIKKSGLAGRYSQELSALRTKLAGIGARNMDSLPPDYKEVPDIDATVVLGQVEEGELIAECSAVIGRVRRQFHLRGRKEAA